MLRGVGAEIYAQLLKGRYRNLLQRSRLRRARRCLVPRPMEQLAWVSLSDIMAGRCVRTRGGPGGCLLHGFSQMSCVQIPMCSLLQSARTTTLLPRRQIFGHRAFLGQNLAGCLRRRQSHAGFGLLIPFLSMAAMMPAAGRSSTTPSRTCCAARPCCPSCWACSAARARRSPLRSPSAPSASLCSSSRCWRMTSPSLLQVRHMHACTPGTTPCVGIPPSAGGHLQVVCITWPRCSLKCKH